MYKESHNLKAVHKFYTFHTDLVFTYANEARRVPRGWDGRVYEIPLLKVATRLSLPVAVYGSTTGVALDRDTTICAIKFTPLLLATNRKSWYLELFKLKRIHWFLFLLLGWAVRPQMPPASSGSPY